MLSMGSAGNGWWKANSGGGFAINEINKKVRSRKTGDGRDEGS